VNKVEMMEDLIRGRRSVRRYRRDPVPPEVIDRLLELATWAPSAANRQDWEFVVVSSPETKGAMAAAVREEWEGMLSVAEAESLASELRHYVRNFDWFSFAPVVIVVTTKSPESYLDFLCGHRAGAVHGGAVSAAMAAQNLMLAAHAMGLATCCLTGPVGAEERLRRILGLGNRRDLVCLLTLGYPAEEPEPPPRKPASDVSRSVE